MAREISPLHVSKALADVQEKGTSRSSSQASPARPVSIQGSNLFQATERPRQPSTGYFIGEARMAGGMVIGQRKASSSFGRRLQSHHLVTQESSKEKAC